MDFREYDIGPKQSPYTRLLPEHKPVRRGRDTFRMHLQLTSPRRAADKLKYLAGSEAAMGAWVGDVPPELAAENIRKAIERA